MNVVTVNYWCILLLITVTLECCLARKSKPPIMVGRDGCVEQDGFELDGRSHYDQLKAAIATLPGAWVQRLPGQVISYDRHGTVVRHIIQWPHVRRWRSGGCWMIIRMCLTNGEFCEPGKSRMWRFDSYSGGAKERTPSYRRLDGSWVQVGMQCEQCPSCAHYPSCPRYPSCPLCVETAEARVHQCQCLDHDHGYSKDDDTQPQRSDDINSGVSPPKKPRRQEGSRLSVAKSQSSTPSSDAPQSGASFVRKVHCSSSRPLSTVPPIKAGAPTPASVKVAIKNVVLYLRNLCANPIEAAAAAVGVSRTTVYTVVSLEAVPAACKSRPSCDLDTMDKSTIRRIVHLFFARGEQPTLDKLLPEVKKQLGEERFPYGRSTLHRILRQIGFKYGKRPGPNLHLMYERADIVTWRHTYLRQIRQFRRDKRPIVYLDETWFTSNDAPQYVWQDIQVQKNPWTAMQAGNDLTLGQRVKSGRGQRIIIVNAVSVSGLVPNALWVFRSNMATTPADYHKEMDAHNFEKWFQDRLLPNLEPQSVIVMDNAPYHSRREVALPSCGRRDDVIKQLEDVGFFKFLGDRQLPNDPKVMNMKTIFALTKQYRSHFDKYAVDEMAKRNGHTILRLPPYHCLFNPIEMVWSYQKHLVRSRSTSRTAAEALRYCEQRFAQLPPTGPEPYFLHVQKLEEQHWKLDGLDLSAPNPPVIIPLYDDEDDEDDAAMAENDFAFSDDDTASEEF